MNLKELKAAMEYRATPAEIFISYCTHPETVRKVDQAELGQMLRKLRIAKGVSLRKMAGDLGFSAPFLSDLERGRRNWTVARVGEFLKLLPQPVQMPSLQIRSNARTRAADPAETNP